MWDFTHRCNLIIFPSHVSLALVHCLTPLAIILICWAFPKIICVGFMAFLVQYTVLVSTAKGTPLAPFTKRFQVNTPYS